MRFAPFLRVLGALLYGFIGYELGIALAGTWEMTSASAPIIWTATIAGALLGFLLSPWLVIAPARAAVTALLAGGAAPIDLTLSGTVSTALVLVVAGLIGSVIPFRRITKVEPAIALGVEP